MFLLALLVIPSSRVPASEEPQTTASGSGVHEVLSRLAGSDWTSSGASRHGADSEMTSFWESTADGSGFVGRGHVLQDGETTSSAALYAYHPRRARWIYTSISSTGAIQEAEELESSESHFVFKGTAYRPDGTQTSFVWRVTLDGADGYRSESMAFVGGEWRSNPASRFSRRETE